MPASTTGVREIFVEANGLRHHLLARGEPGRPVVLLIHALAAQAHTFDQAAEQLAADFHVYALDLRGRGESEWGPREGYRFDTYVADLEAVRLALGLPRLALVGTWMGGLLAMLYASRYPDVVTSVVMNDIGPDVEPGGGQRLQRYLAGSPNAFPDLDAVERYYQEHYGPHLAGLSKQQVSEFARWNVRRNDLGVYTWKYDPAIREVSNEVGAVDLWEALKQVQAPLLVLRGRDSDLLSAATVAKIQEIQPGSEVAEVSSSGHAPALVDPATIDTIRAFLRQH